MRRAAGMDSLRPSVREQESSAMWNRLSRVRRWSVTTALLLALAAGTSAGQTTPYIAPRTKDGRPNLNGVWQALNEANWNIESHSAGPAALDALGAIGAVPPGQGVVEGGEIPYQPWAVAKRNDNFKARMTADPEIKCYLPGVPRANYMAHPFQIIQSQEHVMLLYQYAGGVRTIYMAGHKEAPADSWMGWSNGRWEGETLVVDTAGFNGLTWFDRAGNFHSDALRVVERYTAGSPHHLDYEVTITDPKVFTRSWRMSMPLYRRMEKHAQILEFRCVEFVEDMMYGHLRKQPTK
jgi:hypothetical protein